MLLKEEKKGLVLEQFLESRGGQVNVIRFTIVSDVVERKKKVWYSMACIPGKKETKTDSAKETKTTRFFVKPKKR